jgi:hypothetical protein
MKTYEIEFCTNNEWLVVFGPYEAAEDSDASEPSREATDLFDRQRRAVESLAGIELVTARGQRMLCHGWNGAHFAWRHAGFGSFETLPAELKACLEAAIDAA